MEINIYSAREIAEVVEKAELFYLDPRHSNGVGVKESIMGSKWLALAIDEGEVIGAGKVVGDGVRFSLIVDLVVRKDHRGKGIGTKIVQALARACNTSHVDLFTDPNDPKLPEFYKKAGFSECPDEHVFEWKRDESENT